MSKFLCSLVTLEAVLKCLMVGSQTPGRLFTPRVFPAPLQIPDRSNNDSSCVTEKSTLTQAAAHDSCSPEDPGPHTAGQEEHSPPGGSAGQSGFSLTVAAGDSCKLQL